jgi:hypothetical protein
MMLCLLLVGRRKKRRRKTKKKQVARDFFPRAGGQTHLTSLVVPGGFPWLLGAIKG